MNAYRNWAIALVLVLILAAPIALGAAALRGILNLAQTYNFRRFQAAGKAAGRGKLGKDAQRFALRYLADHPEARHTLEVSPEDVLAAGPCGSAAEMGLGSARVARLRELGVS